MKTMLRLQRDNIESLKNEKQTQLETLSNSTEDTDEEVSENTDLSTEAPTPEDLYAYKTLIKQILENSSLVVGTINVSRDNTGIIKVKEKVLTPIIEQIPDNEDPKDKDGSQRTQSTKEVFENHRNVFKTCHKVQFAK